MLSREGLALTKSEARIVQILLTDYPVSGLHVPPHNGA
jgi:hypothetical protein